ncbi:unnamed protein product, partial [Scytosiphon promiscuus]
GKVTRPHLPSLLRRPVGYCRCRCGWCRCCRWWPCPSSLRNLDRYFASAPLPHGVPWVVQGGWAVSDWFVRQLAACEGRRTIGDEADVGAPNSTISRTFAFLALSPHGLLSPRPEAFDVPPSIRLALRVFLRAGCYFAPA